ncbi:hypothetical protein XU18_0921 [Perkinsela sp. CCAP 1560/4]|nr:hypothetical protein XU18_0921 [Perkinsela sp. CCAP 1560/4]|eukprot:KNH08578.1 hypothetical protein XU18_0921 [Perkinsela sp. CCAP 1560/4]
MDFLLFPAAIGDQTPSAQEFVHVQTEQEMRCLAWEIVRTAAILLKADIFVATRAMTLLHRLYAHVSMRECDVWEAALASFVLSLKLEEYQRKLGDIVRVFVRLQYRYLDMSAAALRQQPSGPDTPQPPNPGSFAENTSIQQENIVRAAMEERKLEEITARITQHERLILKSSGYICSVGQPHLYVAPLCAVALEGIDSLRSTLHSNHTSETSNEIAFNHSYFVTENISILDAFIQKAWNFVSDSYETTLCCRESARSVAGAAVFLVVCANLKHSPSAGGDVGEEHLAAQQRVINGLLRATGTTASELARISREILQVYSRQSLPRYFAIDSMSIFKSKIASIEKSKRDRLKVPTPHARLHAKLQFGRDRKIGLGGKDSTSCSTGNTNESTEKPREASDALAMLAAAGIPSMQSRNSRTPSQSIRKKSKFERS